MRRAVFLAAFLLIATSAAAQTFRAENGVFVRPFSAGFEVQSDGGHGARGMWCAAADYARRVLGAASVDRIYVAEGRPPGLGQRAPVRFTMDASGLTPRTVIIVGASLSRAGSNLSVGHAYRFCADARLIN